MQGIPEIMVPRILVFRWAFGPPHVRKLMAQNRNIECTGSTGSILLGILEVQVVLKSYEPWSKLLIQSLVAF